MNPKKSYTLKTKTKSGGYYIRNHLEILHIITSLMALKLAVDDHSKIASTQLLKNIASNNIDDAKIKSYVSKTVNLLNQHNKNWLRDLY